MTPADHARALKRDWPHAGPTEIARELARRGVTITRQAVSQALAVGETPRKRGRPSTGGAVLLRERDLPAHVLELARKQAADDGVSLREHLVHAVAASVVPESEWLREPSY